VFYILVYPKVSVGGGNPCAMDPLLRFFRRRVISCLQPGNWVHCCYMISFNSGFTTFDYIEQTKVNRNTTHGVVNHIQSSIFRKSQNWGCCSGNSLRVRAGAKFVPHEDQGLTLQTSRLGCTVMYIKQSLWWLTRLN
jgi:hypothetical protein